MLLCDIHTCGGMAVVMKMLTLPGETLAFAMASSRGESPTRLKKKKKKKRSARHFLAPDAKSDETCVNLRARKISKVHG